MAITAEAIWAAFQEGGLRNTRPRQRIAARLAARAVGETDFTAEELWHELQRDDPQIGRATVYRALEALREQGIVSRVALGDGTHRYRVCGGAHHHHVTCTACHRTVEVETCLPDSALSHIAHQTGFVLDGHVLELFGRCRDCR